MIGKYRLTQLNGICEDVDGNAIMEEDECKNAAAELKMTIYEVSRYTLRGGLKSWSGYSMSPENSPPGCIHELRTVPYKSKTGDRFPFPWLNENKNGKRNPRFQSVCKRTGKFMEIILFLPHSEI